MTMQRGVTLALGLLRHGSAFCLCCRRHFSGRTESRAANQKSGYQNDRFCFRHDGTPRAKVQLERSTTGALSGFQIS
jgi:hypothetical protein